MEEANIGVEQLVNSSWDPEFGYQKTNNDVPDFPLHETEYVGPASGLHIVLKTNTEDVQHKCTNNNAENYKAS